MCYNKTIKRKEDKKMYNVYNIEITIENNMDRHDKEEIEKLKSFKKWYLWFLSASEEEKKEYLKNRWK